MRIAKELLIQNAESRNISLLTIKDDALKYFIELAYSTNKAVVVDTEKLCEFVQNVTVMCKMYESQYKQLNQESDTRLALGRMLKDLVDFANQCDN